MGSIINCTGPDGMTGSCDLTQSLAKSGANILAKKRLRIRGDKLAFIALLVRVLWVVQFQARAQVVAAAAAPAETENGLVPAPAPAGGPEVALTVGEAPENLLAPPSQQAAPEEQLLQFREVISSLAFNNYLTVAYYLSNSLFLLPLNCTLFVPTDSAFVGISPERVQSLGQVLWAYHTILQQFSFQQIKLLPVGTRFITMANDSTIIVTSAVPGDFRVDNVSVIQENVCSSAAMALNVTCHGVDRILNMTEWGSAVFDQFSPSPSPNSGAPMSEHGPGPILLPPGLPLPQPLPLPLPHKPTAGPDSGGISPSGPLSRIESWFPFFSVVFLYCTVFV